MLLYKYIFYKVYFFYIQVFKEKDIPHWFAASVITLIFVTNIVVASNALLYIYTPESIQLVDIYYKYFALVVLVVVMWYINTRRRYLHFIKDVDKLPNNKRRLLSYISVLYVLAVFVCFFGMSELIRDYNMQ